MGRYIWSIVVPAGALAYIASRWLAIELVPDPSPPPANAAAFLSHWISWLRPEPREHAEFILAILLVGITFFLASVVGWRYGQGVVGKSSHLGVLWRGFVQSAVLGCVVWYIREYVRSTMTDWPFVTDLVLGKTDLWRLGLTSAMIGAILASGLVDRIATVFSRPYPSTAHLVWDAAGWSCAALASLVAVLPGLHLDQGAAPHLMVAYHLPYQLGEFAAVYNGLTPDVDCCSQYQRLMAFFLAPVFYCYSLTPGHFTVVMLLLNFLELMACYWILTRVTQSSWAALVVFAMIMAAGAVPIDTEVTEGFSRSYTPYNYFAFHPLRSFGPCVTAVAIVCHLTYPRQRILLAVAGFVGLMSALNNFDFGLPVFVAAGGAVLLSGELTPQRLGETFVSRISWFLLGAAVGIVAWLCLIFARTSALPHFGEMIEYQRIFTMNGFGMLPAPNCGLHHLVLLTLMAALVQGMLRPREERLLNGLLIFAAISGLGPLAYYMGRSHPHILRALGSSWGFALGLLTIAACKDLKGHRPWEWVTRPAMLGLVIGLGYCTLQIPRLPNPMEEWRRLQQLPGPSWKDLRTEVNLVKFHQRPGDTVVIYYPYAHLIAMEANVKNVNPYTGLNSILTHAQVRRLVETCDRHHVQRFYGCSGHPEIFTALTEAGFRLLDSSAAQKHTDTFCIWERAEQMDRHVLELSRGEGIAYASNRAYVVCLLHQRIAINRFSSPDPSPLAGRPGGSLL